MLRKLLESRIGQLSDREFREIIQLATADIVVNRIAFGRWTSFHEAMQIAEICCTVLQRGRNVA